MSVLVGKKALFLRLNHMLGIAAGRVRVTKAKESGKEWATKTNQNEIENLPCRPCESSSDSPISGSESVSSSWRAILSIRMERLWRRLIRTKTSLLCV